MPARVVGPVVIGTNFFIIVEHLSKSCAEKRIVLTVRNNNTTNSDLNEIMLDVWKNICFLMFVFLLATQWLARQPPSRCSKACCESNRSTNVDGLYPHKVRKWFDPDTGLCKNRALSPAQPYFARSPSSAWLDRLYFCLVFYDFTAYWKELLSAHRWLVLMQCCVWGDTERDQKDLTRSFVVGQRVLRKQAVVFSRPKKVNGGKRKNGITWRYSWSL